MAQTFGYIGLGDIGAPMAARIAQAGLDLVVWNRTASKMQPIVAQGARAAGSAFEVGSQADVVFLCLDSIEAVESVVFGPEGLAASPRVQLIVDNSTMPPHITRGWAERLAASGKRWLDAPVSGGRIGAEAGTLAVFVGGAAQDLEVARPAIAAYAGKITHMGELGAGQVTKACNQILNFGIWLSIAEALNVAERFGLDKKLVPHALEGGLADSTWLKVYRTSAAPDLTRTIDAISAFYQGRVDPSYAGNMYIALKDVSMAMDIGRENGAPMPVLGLFENLVRIFHYQRPASKA